MTEQLRQSLSAVIDGEADAFELRRVLDELDRNPELRATWDSYHLIGSVLRGERTVRSRSAARALANRVPRAVREATDPASSPLEHDALTGAGKAAPTAPARVRKVLGVALAASLALAIVVGLLPDEAELPAATPLAAAAGEVSGPAGAPLARQGVSGESLVAELGATERRARQASAADLRRAQAYMLQHAQQQGLEHRGVISLVKMATYEAPR